MTREFDYSRTPNSKHISLGYRAAGLVIKASMLERLIHATGMENIPTDDQGYILAAAHHGGYWDVVGSSYPIYKYTRRAVNWAAKDTFASVRLVGKAFEGLHAYPVNRDEFEQDQLDYGVRAVQAGVIIGVAVEGRRTNGSTIGRVKRGAGIIACMANARILPVATRGQDYNIPGKKRPLVVPPIHVAYGKIITPTDYSLADHLADESGMPRYLVQAVKQTTRDIKVSIQELLDEVSQRAEY